MKALTLTQPWATLVAIGAKKIETRSWNTAYRGPLAIHAAKGLGKGGRFKFQAVCAEEPFNSVLTAYMQSELANGITPLEAANLIPFGAIVAVCELVDIFPTDGFTFAYERATDSEYSKWWLLNDQERAFGDYTPGRYAWLLGNVEKLETPIPAKGALGLWNWNEEGLKK